MRQQSFDYSECGPAIQGRAKGHKTWRNLKANVTLRELPQEDGTIWYAIRFHNTDIITYKPNGDIVLYTGGWNTYWTKRNMNTYLPDPIGVYQYDFTWYAWNWETREDFGEFVDFTFTVKGEDYE